MKGAMKMPELSAFCNGCGDISPYRIAVENVKTTQDDIEFEFPCAVAICEKCGELIFNAELHNRNVEVKQLNFEKSKKLHNSIGLRG